MATNTMYGSPLNGHNSSVWSLAFSPDGQVLASSSEEILLWDVASGQTIGEPLWETQRVFSLAYSSDGQYLASGSRAGEVALWDLNTIEFPYRRWQFLASGMVGSVAFSPDGYTLAFGDFESVTLLDTATGERIRSFTNPKGVGGISFSPDGQILTAGRGSDHAIILWKTRALSGPGQRYSFGNVSDIIFQQDSQTLLILGDGNIFSHNIDTHQTMTSTLDVTVWPSLNLGDPALEIVKNSDGTISVKNRVTGNPITRLLTKLEETRVVP